MRNNGNTPAHDVFYRAAAAILSDPLPPDFKFSLPTTWAGGAIITPQVPLEANAVISEFVPDEDVNEIKIGRNKCLYVWGVVKYRDIFKIYRRTTFAHKMFFPGEPGKEIVRGFYMSRHNKSS